MKTEFLVDQWGCFTPSRNGYDTFDQIVFPDGDAVLRVVDLGRGSQYNPDGSSSPPDEGWLPNPGKMPCDGEMDVEQLGHGLYWKGKAKNGKWHLSAYTHWKPAGDEWVLHDCGFEPDESYWDSSRRVDCITSDGKIHRDPDYVVQWRHILWYRIIEPEVKNDLQAIVNGIDRIPDGWLVFRCVKYWFFAETKETPSGFLHKVLFPELYACEVPIESACVQKGAK